MEISRTTLHKLMEQLGVPNTSTSRTFNNTVRVNWTGGVFAKAMGSTNNGGEKEKTNTALHPGAAGNAGLEEGAD